MVSHLKNNCARPMEVETSSKTGQVLPPHEMEPLGGHNPDELLSRLQVEAEYGITRKFLERAAWSGDGPPMVKFGYRTVRYRRADIVAFIAAHRMQGVSS